MPVHSSIKQGNSLQLSHRLGLKCVKNPAHLTKYGIIRFVQVRPAKMADYSRNAVGGIREDVLINYYSAILVSDPCVLMDSDGFSDRLLLVSHLHTIRA